MWQKTTIRLLFAAFLTTGGIWAAQANQLGDGMFAYDQGQYREAFEAWHPIAEAGDVTAQTLIAMVYERGEGVARDLALAAQWYERAANSGHPQAQFQIGRIYRDGAGVDVDPVEAFAWFSLAADAIPKNSNGENSATKALTGLVAQMDTDSIARAETRLLELRASVRQQ